MPTSASLCKTALWYSTSSVVSMNVFSSCRSSSLDSGPFPPSPTSVLTCASWSSTWHRRLLHLRLSSLLHPPSRLSLYLLPLLLHALIRLLVGSPGATATAADGAAVAVMAKAALQADSSPPPSSSFPPSSTLDWVYPHVAPVQPRRPSRTTASCRCATITTASTDGRCTTRVFPSTFSILPGAPAGAPSLLVADALDH